MVATSLQLPQGDCFSHAQGRERKGWSALHPAGCAAGLGWENSHRALNVSSHLNSSCVFDCLCLLRWTCERFASAFCLRKCAEFHSHGSTCSSSTADLVDIAEILCHELQLFTCNYSATMTRFHWVRTFVSVVLEEPWPAWPIIQYCHSLCSATVDQKEWLQRWKTHTHNLQEHISKIFHPKLKRPTYITKCYECNYAPTLDRPMSISIHHLRFNC